MALGLRNRTLDICLAAFISTVFNLDAHRVFVAHIIQGREERTPIDIAQSRQLGTMPFDTHDAVLVDQITVDFGVFSMNMDEAPAELADAAHGVDTAARWFLVGGCKSVRTAGEMLAGPLDHDHTFGLRRSTSLCRRDMGKSR